MSRIRTSILILLVLFAPAAALAQSWPTAQPIKAIITFSAGSASDVIARAVFDQVSAQIGQTILVENRVGAGGTLGANVVSKAPPDGYALLVHTSSHTVTAATFAQLLHHMGVKRFHDGLSRTVRVLRPQRPHLQ